MMTSLSFLSLLAHSVLFSRILVQTEFIGTIIKVNMAGAASTYVLGVPGHTQFLAQIRVKTYVGTPSFYH